MKGMGHQNPMDDNPTDDKKPTVVNPLGKRDKDNDLGDHPNTAVLSSKQISRRANQSKSAQGTVSFGQRELILVIRGMVERLVLPNDLSIVLGRSDLLTRYHPDVDLTPYGALDRGVSRGHARIHVEDDSLYVTDLGSTNGTFLGGKRLEPNTPTLIGKGDELLLGRLAVQVLFR